jgi:MFS family permease
VMMTGLFATLFYIPLFLQTGQGYQAFDTGLLILPQALVMAVLTPFAGRLYDVVGPRWLVVSGLLVAALGSFLLSGINVDMTRHEVILWTCIRSSGVGLSMMSVMTGGLSSLPHDLTSSGSSINTVAQRVSAALGLAGLTALATTQQGDLSAGRGALLSGSNPHLAHLGYAQLSGLYRSTQFQVLAESYSNIFLLTGILTCVAAVGGLFLRSGPAPKTDGPPTVQIE